MGGRPKTENSKKVAAREKKQTEKIVKKAVAKRVKEDAEWADSGKSAKEARKREKEAKAREAQAKKAKLRALAKADEEKVALSIARKQKQNTSKMTMAQRNRIEEQKAQQRAMEREQQAMRQRNIITQHVELEANTNLELAQQEQEDIAKYGKDGVMIASSIEAALEGLSAMNVDGGDGPKHPEKKMKAAYQEFYERRYPEIKEESPNLKMSQIKQMIYKEFQKSPENPMRDQPRGGKRR